ncbi:MAG: lipopolysaccharide biosynthesis protein [Clostridia bacterium]|nr:lipopolysaccharide biosynthesis protein [Clostridia bacterium]
MDLIHRKGRPCGINKRHRGTRLKLPALASLANTGAGIFCRLTAFLLTPVFTRIMTKEALGEYSLFTTSLGIISTLGSLELSGGVLFSLLSDNREGERDLLRAALLTVVTITALLSLPSSYFYYRASGVKSLLLPAALLVCAVSRVTLLLYNGQSRYRYRYRVPTLLSLTEALIPPATSLLLFKRAGASSLGIVRCLCLSAVLVALALPCAVGLLKRGGVPSPSCKDALEKRGAVGANRMRILHYIKIILATTLPTLPYFISVSLISSLDKVVIATRLGGVRLAEYSVAQALGSGISMLTSGAGAALTPWIIRKFKSGKSAEISGLVGMLSKIIPLGSLLLLTASPELFRLLAPSGYQTAIGVVYAVSLGALPLFLSGCCFAIIICTKKARLPSMLSLIPAALSLMINLVLIGRGGIIVSAVSLVISYTALYLTLSFSLRKIIGNSPVNDASCLQITLLCAVISSLLYLSRDIIIVRAIAAVAIIACLIPTLIRLMKLVREE